MGREAPGDDIPDHDGRLGDMDRDADAREPRFGCRARDREG